MFSKMLEHSARSIASKASMALKPATLLKSDSKNF